MKQNNLAERLNKKKMKNLKELKAALKNNCLNVYISGIEKHKRVISVKESKGVLLVKTFSGWVETNYQSLIQQ